ncbi:MAG: tetratricopeptide repeat protein [Phycisphaeraceae bacterium]|nr:tetratricopeptide repeat protein [Phycisphaeraceae bacterium]
MSIRAKTRRRLLLLLLMVVVIVTAAVAVYVVRQRQIAAEIAAMRPAGIAAAQAGDYRKALDLLGGYLKKTPQKEQDSDSVYWYTVARRHIPLEQGKHLYNASTMLRRLMDADPNYTAAWDDLLKLLTDLNQNTEALKYSERRLQQDPNNAWALYAKAMALARLKRFDEAMTVSDQLLAAQPTFFAGLLLNLSLLEELKRPQADILDRFRKLKDAHPQEPAFDLLLSMIHFEAQDLQGAVQAIQPALTWTPTTLDETRNLMQQLIRLGLLDESTQALIRAADATKDPQLHQELVRRLWEMDNTQETLDRTAALDPADLQVNPAELAYRALTLHRLERRDEAQKIVAALATRTDAVSKAWTLLLNVTMTTQPVSLAQAVEECRKATELDPSNPYAWLVLGQAYHDMGEKDLAIDNLTLAARRSPLWPLPYVRLARLLAESARAEEAVSASQTALRLAPNSWQVIVTHALAWAAAVETSVLANEASLLNYVNQIQKDLPGEPETLPIQAWLYARQGQSDQARTIVRDALAAEKPLPRPALMRLATISRQFKLGLEDQCQAMIEKHYGLSPEAVFQDALTLHREGKTEQGLSLIERQVQQAGQDQNLARPWRINRARYLEATASPQALQAWKELAETYANQPQVLQLVLEAGSVWTDRAFVQQTIDQLHKLTSDQALGWRTAQARLLLSGTPTDQDLAQASDMLQQIITTAPDQAEPRLLLAACFERLGNPDRAIEQFSAALAQQPSLIEPRLELARLLLNQGLPDRARIQLQEIREPEKLPADIQRRMASLLGQLGDASKAASMLQDLLDKNQLDESGQLQLVAIYRRLDQNDKAQTILDNLLGHPSPAAVEYAADYFASQGQMDRARQILALLDTMDIPPDKKQSLLSGFAVRHQTVEEALTALHQAAAANPEQPLAWLRLISYGIRTGKVDDAVQSLDAASAALPKDPQIQALVSLSPILQQYSQDTTVWPLLSVMVEDPPSRPQAQEVLDLLARAQQQNAPAAETLASLRRLADRYPGFAALQNLTARRFLAAGKPTDAAEVARRAMQRFPDAVEPAWLAAEALASAGQWTEALAVAEEWRRRSVTRPMAADLMIAEARLQLDQPQEAQNRMQRYLEWALTNPDAYAPVIIRQTRALLAQGNNQQAAELLTPLLDRGPSWRSAWISLASENITDSNVAAEWLAKVQPAADTETEKLLLAKAWFALATRASKDEYRQTADQILQALASASPSPATLFEIAVLYENVHDYAQAEKGYRRVLKASADFDAAKNNLAMVLVRANGDLSEARKLAEQAVQSQPKLAPFVDTLGVVQWKQRQLDAAIQSFRHALELEPQVLEWQSHLACALQDAGHKDEAVEWARKIITADPKLETIPPDMVQPIRDLASPAPK